MLVFNLSLLFCLVIFDLPIVQLQQGVSNDPNKVLKLVHTVFRHGNKTPSPLYPKDPYINEQFDPYGLGQLTNAGKQLLLENGKWLRRQYINYLETYYNSDLIWIQAADYDRTIMSMATFLAGLYPPKNTCFQWNKQLNWQPIPIYVVPLHKDTLLQIPTPCPRFYEAVNEAYKRFLTDNKQILNNLTALTGWSLKTNYYVYTLYSTLYAEADYGLTLPDWTNEYYPDKLKSLAEVSYIYNVFTDELKRIAAGPFIQQMINDWLQKINGTITPSNRKMFIYAGHDITIVNLLYSLNVWNEHQYPDYGTTIIFELLQYKNTGVYGVQVYIRKPSDNTATLLTIPGCDSFCPMETFLELTKNIIPTNLAMECASTDSSFIATESFE